MSIQLVRNRLPQPMDGGSSALLRGDPITGDRYWSREFMQREWDHMWTRVWHIGARLSQIPEPGDYCVHDFRHESVLLVRQEGGGVRAFYNVCRHRGNKCTFEYMALHPDIEGAETVVTVSGPRSIEEAAAPENLTFGADAVGDFIDEDLSVAVQQQRGLHSRGYRDAHLTEQEARVRRFHEVLNDYLEGRR